MFEPLPDLSWDVYIAGVFVTRVYYYGYVQSLLETQTDIMIVEVKSEN